MSSNTAMEYTVLPYRIGKIFFVGIVLFFLIYFAFSFFFFFSIVRVRRDNQDNFSVPTGHIYLLPAILMRARLCKDTKSEFF